jgi:HSP20 family protein
MTSRREHPLQRLARDFDTLFNRMWGGPLAPLDQDLDLVRVWDFDVSENDKEVVVRAELPGFEENEIDVQINNDTLAIKAEKEQKGDGQQEYRSFYRVVTLPSGIDAEKAQASYRNGVLELHIPRAAGGQPRRIQVQGQQAPAGQQGQQASSGQAGATSSQATNQGQQSGKQSMTAASEKAKK